MKLELKKCISSKECGGCDISSLIKYHVKAIFQLYTMDIEDYNMRLITTKCLNTAVILTIIVLGIKKGQKYTNFCDTDKTINRHQSREVNNKDLIIEMKKKVLRPTKLRYMYYILMTDNYFP